MVVDDPHFHAFVRFLDENIGNFLTYLVGREDEILQIDVLLGREQIALERVILLLALGENVGMIARKKMRLGDGVDQAYDLLAAVAQAELAGVDGVEFLLAAQAQAIFARDDDHALEAAAKKQIEEKAQYGEQHEHGNPRQRFHRVAVFRDDNGYCAQYGQDVNYRENDKYRMSIREQLGENHNYSMVVLT